MKFYLFGAGAYGKAYIDSNGTSGVIAFIDNDGGKQSMIVGGGIRVLSYTAFKKAFDPRAERIIITCRQDAEIYRQLKDDGYEAYIAGFSKKGLPMISYELYANYVNALDINITERLPTHKDKEHIISEFLDRFGKTVLVETGTYLGATVEAFKDKVAWMASVEIKKELYDAAVGKFSGCDNVHLYLGDSSEQLPHIIRDIPDNLRGKALFFLDGHWSKGITGKGEKDTPILEETQVIRDFYPSDVVMLIDDARVFKKHIKDYPEFSVFESHVKKLWPGAIIFRESDIIHVIVPA